MVRQHMTSTRVSHTCTRRPRALRVGESHSNIDVSQVICSRLQTSLWQGVTQIPTCFPDGQIGNHNPGPRGSVSLSGPGHANDLGHDITSCSRMFEIILISTLLASLLQITSSQRSCRTRFNTNNKLAKMPESDIVPFKVDIPQSEVDRLKRKLQDTRLPPKEIVPGAGNKYGVFSDMRTSIVQHSVSSPLRTDTNP